MIQLSRALNMIQLSRALNMIQLSRALNMIQLSRALNMIQLLEVVGMYRNEDSQPNEDSEKQAWIRFPVQGTDQTWICYTLAPTVITG
jgi:hypothetical protein